ncbi:MAG TPA: DUF4190 domain-containing protein [Blastocatellia bacterium]|nr:DUF4190 domain-containing protein [Blastocatellia bacterium]
MPLSTGVSHCANCGATVGTLFSEVAVPAPSEKEKRHREATSNADFHYKVEKAQERANNSIILALASFFCPGIGFFLGTAAIVLGALAARSLKAHNVEDGRGSALAGLIIGVLGLIAQGAYVVYVVKSGKLPFLG